MTERADELRTFTFVERCVSFPAYRISARTLEEAAKAYAERGATGVDGPDSEEVDQSGLTAAHEGDEAVPRSRWERLVTDAVNAISLKALDQRSAARPGMGADGQDAAPPDRPLQAHPELYQYLDVSTVHITQRDDELLKEDAAWYLSDEPYSSDAEERMVAASKHDGYFVQVQFDAELAAEERIGLLKRGYSEALLSILDLARRHKAQWVVLDVDGAEYPGLSTFDW